MAKTLYDILELSPTASPEAIRAAYERLSQKFDPYAEHHQGKAEIRIQHDAVKEAFFTLSNPAKRLSYDRSIGTRPEPSFGPVLEVEPFWTMPKMIVAALMVVALGGWYVHHQREQARIAAEREIAAARAREAEARAQEEAQKAAQARTQSQDERARQRDEARARSELERARRDSERDQRLRESMARSEAARERSEQVNAQRTAEFERQRKENEARRRESEALEAARRQAAREREELCRIERERYGKAISC